MWFVGGGDLTLALDLLAGASEARCSALLDGGPAGGQTRSAGPALPTVSAGGGAVQDTPWLLVCWPPLSLTLKLERPLTMARDQLCGGSGHCHLYSRTQKEEENFHGPH